jgi:hypothetical protein
MWTRTPTRRIDSGTWVAGAPICGSEDITQHARLNEEIDVVEGEHVGVIKKNSSDDDDNNDVDDEFNDNDRF